MVGGSFWSVLSSLRQSQFAARCTMLVMLRVREPLSWYRSYYDWAVLSRQKTGDSVQWGTNFTDWLPSNMQSRFLLHGTRNQPSQWAPEMARRRSGGLPQKLLEKRWAEIEKIVRSADVVSPLERLDDALALVVKRSGFLRTAEYVSTRPSDMRGRGSARRRLQKWCAPRTFAGGLEWIVPRRSRRRRPAIINSMRWRRSCLRGSGGRSLALNRTVTPVRAARPARRARTYYWRCPRRQSEGRGGRSALKKARAGGGGESGILRLRTPARRGGSSAFSTRIRPYERSLGLASGRRLLAPCENVAIERGSAGETRLLNFKFVLSLPSSTNRNPLHMGP